MEYNFNISNNVARHMDPNDSTFLPFEVRYLPLVGLMDTLPHFIVDNLPCICTEEDQHCAGCFGENECNRHYRCEDS
jgi:hypothetical protein